MKLKPIKIGGHRGNWNLFVFKGVGEGWKQLNNLPFRTKQEAIDVRKYMREVIMAWC